MRCVLFHDPLLRSGLLFRPRFTIAVPLSLIVVGDGLIDGNQDVLITPSRANERSCRRLLSPTGLILLARWRQDRRAGNGILIEGSSPAEMHHRRTLDLLR